MRILGAILAGGRSTRFGSDKAMAMWRDRPLIAHAIDTIRPHVDAVVVCGRMWGEETCLPDRPAAGLGPLGGLNAALRYGAENDFDRALTMPCDVPALPHGLIDRLLAHDEPACVAQLPVVGIWTVADAQALDRHLAGRPSGAVRAWAEVIGAARVTLNPEERLINVNRPADLAALDG